MSKFESTFLQKEASKRGTDGQSTFWPTICIIFCPKVRHRLPSWLQHPLQMAAVLKAFTSLPRKSDRSDAEVSEHRESHALRFGKCL